jgi:maltose alpha-D-glucosyltransferase/alpha-amylase
MSVDTWLEQGLPLALPGFLPRQRWFAGKAREIQRVDVEDAVWLAGSPGDVAFVVTAVRYADGTTEQYAMLIGLAGQPADLPILAQVGTGPARWAVESAGEATAARALLNGFLSNQAIPMRHGGRLLYGDTNTSADDRIARVVGCGVVEPIGAEQSNTSLRLDRQAVFKLFRRVEPGENPDLEISRFLTNEAAFRAMPALRGSLTYVAATGEPSTVGILQDWIDNLGDGWTHVVGLLRQPDSRTNAEALMRDLHCLGVITADLHGALCAETTDPAFAPEPVTAADVRAWQASCLQRVARTSSLLEQHISGLNPESRQLGETLLERRDQMAAAVDVPELTGSSGFRKIRIHGDYHLGQVLKTRDGFAVIDFEGEPVRPLAERRLKCSALKDVASMIRSFDYATGAARTGDRNTPDDRSTGRLRRSFLDGYLTSAFARDAPFVPRDRGAVGTWIDFFEFEKALYEVDYELNNRPDWAPIPLRGLLSILGGKAGREARDL